MSDELIDEKRSVPLWLLPVGLCLLAVAVFVLILLIPDDGSGEDDLAEFREVAITECEPPSADTAQRVRGVAENESSKRSDYRIEVAVFTLDRTRIGTGSTDVRDVEPRQRAVWNINTDTDEEDWDDEAFCEVTHVERTASL